jgi:diaminopimelate epimerase
VTIPFFKAHGAGNDFLYSFQRDMPTEPSPSLARAMCNRHTGIGADGWYIVSEPEPSQFAVSLYNSDGSKAELSGNGTRCAAALLIHLGLAAETLTIGTGSGPRTLTLVNRDGANYLFRMDMGVPSYSKANLRYPLSLRRGIREVTIIDVGNPQCALVVDSLDFDWRSLGAEVEVHPRFPNRTNVSFIQPLDKHRIAARFYERGAGPTLSSGTGSTGAAVAAILLGLAKSPVIVESESVPLEVIWRQDSSETAKASIELVGPAAITASGEYYWN